MKPTLLAAHHRALLPLTLILFISQSTGLKIGGEKAADEPDRGAVRKQPSTDAPASSKKPLLVVGSLNLDVIVEVDRLPKTGENIQSRSPNAQLALGGKGANQAIAAARLAGEAASVDFVCQFGNDAHAQQLEKTLKSSGVGLDYCGRSTESGSGQGLVFLEKGGSVSAVVLGGACSCHGGKLSAPRLHTRQAFSEPHCFATASCAVAQRKVLGQWQCCATCFAMNWMVSWTTHCAV